MLAMLIYTGFPSGWQVGSMLADHVLIIGVHFGIIVLPAIRRSDIHGRTWNLELGSPRKVTAREENIRLLFLC